jgi:hypothetical protein
VEPGNCTVSDPAGEAARYAGPGILPDGRRVTPQGSEWIFEEKDLEPGLTTALMLVPGTRFAVTVDTGDGPHSVRAVDLNKMGSGNPVTGFVRFAQPSTLNTGIAFVAPNHLYVATNDGAVQALALDLTTGALTRDDARSIPLPDSVDDTGAKANFYVSGLAATPDGKRLIVSSVFDKRLLILDVDQKTVLGSIDLGEAQTFGVWLDPRDPRFAYATMWGGRGVVEVDVVDGKRLRKLPTRKNPQGLAFLDARWIAVGDDFGDSISLVDRLSGTSTQVPVDTSTDLHGFEPSSLAFDGTRLYATLAGINAVGVWNVDLTASPPRLTPAGRIPTSWWPSAVDIRAGGGLVITTMRGRGNGPIDKRFPPDDGDAMAGVRGGIQLVPSPDPTRGEAEVKANNDLPALPGAPRVTCPTGVDDFPLPSDNTRPSSKIKHVVFIVRENKAFDGLLGDMPGVNGDPKLTFKETTRDMDAVWKNFRTLAKTFALGDNFYNSAELSIQGHLWTTFGRTNDFGERTWSLTGYARSAYRSPIQPQGVSDIGIPEEGSLFDWLQNHDVPFDVLGEACGMPKVVPGKKNPSDVRYPGGFIQSMGYPDIEKACYTAGRLRVRCDLGRFVYMTLPNDHTVGVSKNNPSPEAMIATNDEATGMMVDALSHSPEWASSLLVVVEDDPSGGGDHVDHHRTPVLFVSPWVRRGYVSRTHMDVASVHKVFAHVLGLPYPNAIVAGAALPLDVFTSTPDYTPYTYAPRVWPLSCGKQATIAEQSLTDSWDLEDIDEAPGLGDQVWRWMRGRQLTELTPWMKEEIARRRQAYNR